MIKTIQISLLWDICNKIGISKGKWGRYYEYLEMFTRYFETY